MSDDENPNRIADCAVEKMIGKPPQVHPAQVTLPNRKGLRPRRSFADEMAQLGIKLIREFRRRHLLVVIHYPANVRGKLRMKDKAHHASATAAFDLLVKLLQRHAERRTRIKVRVAPQSFRDALILVVKNRRERSEQMRGEDGPLRVG